MVYRFLTLLFLIAVTVFSHDLIIDRSGNEINCTVIATTAHTVSFLRDSSLAADSLPVSAIFMIKRVDGTKSVFTETSTPAAYTRASAISDTFSRHWAVGLLADYGAFGLFNVNNDFSRSKYGKYTLGGTAYAEYRLNHMYTVGVECIMRWAKPDTHDSARLLIDPNIRVKALFPVMTNLMVGPVAGGGISIWPKYEGKTYLDSTFYDDRFGWDLRGALEIQYVVSPVVSIDAEVGYSISSTESRSVWISHDMMLVSVGPRIVF